MKKIGLPLLFLLFALACKRRVTRETMETNLKTAWYHFLIQAKNYDSTKVKFNVKDVVYYEDKTLYLCQFTVEMRSNGHDTTGQMFGSISKDFSSIKRKW
jgi:hypothetical protein